MAMLWLTAVCLAVLAFLPETTFAIRDAKSNDAQAQAIVDGFSSAELVGQMTQIDLGTVMNNTSRQLNETAVRSFAKQYIGSYFNMCYNPPANGSYGYNATEFREIIQRIQEITMEENGGHPMIYGLGSVHGANYVEGSVIFPQQINAGASFNPDLVYEMGRTTARDMEYCGSSVLSSISRETRSGPAPTRHSSYNQTAACLKHFIGYSKTPTGHDRDGINMPDFDLLNYFLSLFKAAMEAGALSVMESYTSLNGDPVISSSKILNDLLRSDLGFKGMLVTDYNKIYILHDFHRVASTREEAVATSLKQTSVDMSMVPSDDDFIEYALNMLEENPDQLARLRESAKRVIKLKLQLGLYDNPMPGKEFVSEVGNEKDVAAALDMARESIVLLKNEDDVCRFRRMPHGPLG